MRVHVWYPTHTLGEKKPTTKPLFIRLLLNKHFAALLTVVFLKPCFCRKHIHWREQLLKSQYFSGWVCLAPPYFGDLLLTRVFKSQRKMHHIFWGILLTRFVIFNNFVFIYIYTVSVISLQKLKSYKKAFIYESRIVSLYFSNLFIS